MAFWVVRWSEKTPEGAKMVSITPLDVKMRKVT